MSYTSFPTLYGKSSTGKLKQWTIIAKQESEEYAELVTEHGYIDGSLQTTSKKVKGKNIGRSNATTPYVQACKDAQSAWKKKYDKNYRPTVEELDDLPFLPMLALKYKDRSHNIKWPCFVQPKLNGIRCIAKKISPVEIMYTSRGGKRFQTLDRFTSDLLQLLDIGEQVDGEIYNPALTFQDIVKRVKRVKTSRFNIMDDPVKYYIYDFIDIESTFRDRWNLFIDRIRGAILQDRINNKNPILMVTKTVEVFSEAEMFKAHKEFTSQGYEGTMIRNADGMYLPDYNSKDLQKFKDFIDEEFVIVGGKEGEGRDEGTVIFQCITKDNKYFDVRPMGTWQQRSAWWETLERQKGKLLTVRFQNYSDDGIPIFPRGVAIRDYE